MLRSALRTFFSAVFSNPSLRRSPVSTRPFCSATAAGRIADVLEILAPHDHLFRASDAKRLVNTLRRCLKSKGRCMVSSLHARSIKFGFDSELIVSNVLLDMYAKVGSMNSCVHLFDEMSDRDLISCCTLISGYVSHGFHLDAYALFVALHRAGWKLNHFVISSVLNGCSAYGILELGLLVHGLVIKSGLGFDRFVEVGFVVMYAKCGSLDDAVKMFYEIPIKSPVTWNSMISGYFSRGFYMDAVDICMDMCRAGFLMDVVTLRVVVAAASALEMFDLCKNLHVYSLKLGFDIDSFVVAEIVKLLTKLGEVDYMHKLYSKIRRPDAFLQSLLISGYQLHGHREDAVRIAEKLLNSEPTSLEEGNIVTVINLCVCKEEGAQVHAYFVKAGHLAGLSINNALMSMYIRSGELGNANLAFRTMQEQDIVSCTTIMAGLIQNREFAEALDIFFQLRKNDIQLDQHCVTTSMSACTGFLDVDIGKQIHCLILKSGLDVSDFVNSSVLNMYAKCGYMNSATRLFSKLEFPQSLILINIMLAGYCSNSQPDKALDLFIREYYLGFIPDQFSYSTVLSACANTGAKESGEQLHASVTKSGYEFADVITGNAIINLYVKCGCITRACKFFYTMKKWNADSYAMLMLGYIENSKSIHASNLFTQMQRSGLPANPVSFARILKGCADTAAIDLGRQIHASIIKMGLVSDIQTEDALIGMYTQAKNKDRAVGTNDKTLNREDVEPDYLITEELSDANKECKLKARGLFKLEKVKEDAYDHGDLQSFHPNENSDSQMHDSSMISYMVPKGSKHGARFKLWDSVSKMHKMFENSSNVLNKILERRVIFKDSTETDYAYLENGHVIIKILKSKDVDGKHLNHAILVIFLNRTQTNLFDRKVQTLKPVKESLAHSS